MFASAMHFDYNKLKEQRRSVLLLTTLGVLVSAFVFGGLFYLVLQLFPKPLPHYDNLAIQTWLGLQGGISLAMALSLPPSSYKIYILSGCYFIVIFSTIVQGLTLNRLVNKLVGDPVEKLGSRDSP